MTTATDKATSTRHSLTTFVVAGGLALTLLGPGAATGEKLWSKKGVEPYRLPVSRVWLSKERIKRPHHDHPAWDLNVPTGTKAFSVQAGNVVAGFAVGNSRGRGGLYGGERVCLNPC